MCMGFSFAYHSASSCGSNRIPYLDEVKILLPFFHCFTALLLYVWSSEISNFNFLFAMIDRVWWYILCFCAILLCILLWRGDIHFSFWEQGTVWYEESGSGGVSYGGTMLISPYGVEDDIIQLLSETKYSLDMWIYILSSKEMISVLKNLTFLWVDVDIILENYVYGWANKTYTKIDTTLTPLWWEVVSDQELWLETNFVHAKAAVLDEATFLIATANLSYTSFWKNREYWYIGTHTWIAQNLTDLFALDMAWLPISSELVHDALLFCPIDCREKIVDDIWSAKERIWIQAQYIEDPWIISALKAKQLAWIEVKLLVWDKQDEGVLDFFGMWVRIYDEYYMHAKNILIDQDMLLMWSMNLSTNGLDNNREIWIRISQKDIVNQFAKQFLRDWDGS